MCWKIPKKDRKYARMSDKAKKSIGMGLVIISVTLVIISLLWMEKPETTVYRASSFADIKPDRIGIRTEGKINVNTCTAEELMTLYGIGPSLAEAWIRERDENGFFYYPEDILDVKGIGEKKLEQILSDLDFQTAHRGG